MLLLVDVGERLVRQPDRRFHRGRGPWWSSRRSRWQVRWVRYGRSSRPDLATSALVLAIGLNLAGRSRPLDGLGSTPVTTPTRPIRPIALAVVKRADELLVFEGRDDVKGETYYRPLGGGIEFGETAADALRREFREELAAELTNVVLLDVLENIFTVFGRPGHEIVFVFEAELADRSWYEREDLGMVLDEGSPVSWRPLREFAGRDLILYPAGLAELLLRKSAEV
jgi:8-oxo-dGTP pyrophosphatase MutT (NUDIX family)